MMSFFPLSSLSLSLSVRAQSTAPNSTTFLPSQLDLQPPAATDPSVASPTVIFLHHGGRAHAVISLNAGDRRSRNDLGSRPRSEWISSTRGGDWWPRGAETGAAVIRASATRDWSCGGLRSVMPAAILLKL
ncbi:hypothetical protein TIFTF001_022002 [Ficus carica]|uniref:Secreted protein n=1 Tax=Ficus carica TaxID=3494 RepID=A0AA88AGY9_FICCA|nr:hypothetical protein TIFTF001_022002 [Ficus carica]